MATSRPLWQQVLLVMSALAVLVSLGAVAAYQVDYQTELDDLRDETTRLAAIVTVQIDERVRQTGATDETVASVSALFGQLPLPAGSLLTLTDRDSRILARNIDAERYVGTLTQGDASAVRAPSTLPPVEQLVGLDGVERIFAHGLIADEAWVLNVGIPVSVASERTSPSIPLVAFGTMALVLALLLTLSWRAIRALTRVSELAQRAAGGDFSATVTSDLGVAELNQLRDSLTDTISRLRDTQQALGAQVEEERRIRSEKEALQRKLIRQERLAAVGDLVSGVAHELNNPLQAILGFSELLTLRTGVEDEVKRELALIQREGERASAIVRNLQRFAGQSSEPAPIRLHDVAASVLELRGRKLENQGIRLEVANRSQSTVLGVFTELQQVVLGFLSNAEQAMRDVPAAQRRLIVRTFDGPQAVRLEVEDSGPGVPEEDEPKLFQPFFTTRSVGEGTGLGLSTSYGIIDAHHGQIGYRRSPGGGALFFFELPLA
jgi:C4-dicarboxylate-specific signal transduction histidine kinase